MNCGPIFSVTETNNINSDNENTYEFSACVKTDTSKPVMADIRF